MSLYYHTVKDWKKQDAAARSPRWKRIVYDLLRPWISQRTRKLVSEATLKAYRPTWVLPERGFPLEERRRWGTSYRSLQGKTVLVQGTGTGWDTISWAELRPAKIIATDMFSFDHSWSEIQMHCSQHLGVDVQFYQAPLEDHSFLPDESVDLCVSDAVYEHCRNLQQVILETRRILKTHGSVYASYGPLWFCAFGDHFDRGGLKNAYNHLILDEDTYKEYVNSHRAKDDEIQSGSRYIELDLFSKLTTSEYLEIFREAGFILDSLILEVSSQAINFLGMFPERFYEMQEKYADRCLQDDFLIKANFVRLKKS